MRCAFPFYPDLDACIEAMECSARDIVTESSITRGDLLSCSGAVATLRCGESPVMDNACLELVEALSTGLGLESGCGGESCGLEGYCDRSDELCPRCVSRAALGEACDGLRCVEGSYCNTSTWLCEKTLAEGAPCDRQSQCFAGGFDSRGWLYCRGGVCAKPRTVGEACVERTDCGIYLRCTNGVCNALAQEGEACADHSECQSFGGCIQGTCAKICGFQRLGEPCYLEGLCLESYCDETASLCVAHKAAGATCSDNTECGEGLFCEVSTAACTARAADGAACALDDECMSQRCIEQTCRRPVCEG
jgi:hypothetical protein